MVRYPKYATTVIGAHSVPDWYEALDRLVAVGQLAMTSMADVPVNTAPSSRELLSSRYPGSRARYWSRV